MRTQKEIAFVLGPRKESRSKTFAKFGWRLAKFSNKIWVIPARNSGQGQNSTLPGPRGTKGPAALRAARKNLKKLELKKLPPLAPKVPALDLGRERAAVRPPLYASILMTPCQLASEVNHQSTKHLSMSLVRAGGLATGNE